MKNVGYEQFSNNIEALKGIDEAQLHKLWSDIYKDRRKPQSNDIIVYQIAYFLQEKKFGGLSNRALNKLSRHADGPTKKLINKYTLENSQQLVREWNGQKYYVLVLGKNAFDYDGRVYKTLSAIAKKITGVHWSGPLFFGLRKQNNGQKR